jgi:hypothetical protein
MDQEMIDYEPPMVVEVGSFNDLTRVNQHGDTRDNTHIRGWLYHPPIEE